MRLIFLYGQAAAGKLTIARALSRRTGFALFHNHLIVDSVAALFPFGSEPFVRLRERFWLDALGEAAIAGQSTIFTFAPEPSVLAGFTDRLVARVAAGGGSVTFVRLTVSAIEQERRIVSASRGQFGKLRSVDLLRALRDQFVQCEAEMPEPAMTIDTETVSPEAAAEVIQRILHLPAVITKR